MPNKVFWYVAPTYRQAKEIVWRDPAMINRYLPDWIVAKKNEAELVITLKNGSVIGIKGADDPDSLRGPNPFGVVLDEFALMKKEVWEEIIAPIAFAQQEAEVEFQGKKIKVKPFYWFVGTPKPTGAYFKELHEKADGREDWFSLTLKAQDSKILTQEQLKEARETMTETAYQQEYECEWFTEGGVVFRGLDHIIYGPYKEPNEVEQRQWGLDLAKHEDWTVLTAINKLTHQMDFFDRYNQIDYNLQKARIEAAMRRLGQKGDWLNADATGVGEPIIDDLSEKGLNVNGIKFTSESKKALVTELSLAIEQKKLFIPNIPELIQELRIFGYEITPSGNIRYGAPEGYHDDCVWSLALAWWEIGSKVKHLSPTERILSKEGIPMYRDVRETEVGSEYE